MKKQGAAEEKPTMEQAVDAYWEVQREWNASLHRTVKMTTEKAVSLLLYAANHPKMYIKANKLLDQIVRKQDDTAVSL